MAQGFTIRKIDPRKPAPSSTMPSRAMHTPRSPHAKTSLEFFTPKRKRILGIAAGSLVLLFVLVYFFVVRPMQDVYAKAQVAMQIGREAAAAAKQQNLAEARTKLDDTERALKDVEAAYKKMAWATYVPVGGAYYRDGRHGLAAAFEFIAAGKIAADAITPYADLLGLSGSDTSFVNLPANKRIEMAVQTLDKVTPKLGEIGQHLTVARDEIDKIDPKRYPAKVNGKEVRAKIQKAKTLSDEAINAYVDAQPLLEILPDMLGQEEVKRYLVLFQNDAELRSTGGFITAYAVFAMDKGNISVEQSEDIYNLDDKMTKRIAAPPEILKYHKGVTYASLRDSNTSPDFYVSMQKFEELLKNIPNAPTYEGIVAVDTHVLVEAMRVLDGEIFVPEYNAKFTVQPDDRCDGCPQVVYELEEFSDRPTGHVRADRKDILGRLLLTLMKKAMGVSPGQYWGPLIQTLMGEVNQKHILAYMKDPEQQKAIESLNFAGRIKEYEGDYLHINDTNFAGGKSNMFTKHYITQDIDVGSDGSVTKTITIDYKNPSAASNCNLEAGGLCLNAVLRNWLRVYVPKGSTLVEFTGAGEEGIATSTSEDLGKTVFEGFLTVRPEGSAHVTLTYKLPFTITGNMYRMLIQKQPGTTGHEFTTIINGKEKEKFNLTTDKDVEYKF